MMGADGKEGKGEKREGGKDRMGGREGKREEREGKELLSHLHAYTQIPMFFS